MPDDLGNVSELRRPGMAWMGELTRGEKGVHATVQNTVLVLGRDHELAGIVAYDDFAHQVVVLRAPPLPFHGAPPMAGPYPRSIIDTDVTLLQGYIQRTYDMRISQQIAQQAVAATAEMRRVHPVKDYLRGLVWDGVERVDTWLATAFGAAPDRYHQAVGRKTLCAAVRRIRYPGAKFDHVLVLEGLQGKGKSRACAALFSTPWFKDDLSHDLSDKDAQQGMAGRWGVELAELQVLVRSTSQAAKAFFSRQIDHFRPTYGRSFVERPRQCIFIGTTNETDYLSDSSGNRRYWPVACAFCNVEWIEANRDQLWAEAVAIEAMGETLWLDDDVTRGNAEKRQHLRMAEDVWTVPVRLYVDPKAYTNADDTVGSQGKPMDGAKAVDILHMGLGIPRAQQNRAAEMRVTAILKLMGWVAHVYRDDAGETTRGWFPPGALLPGDKGKRVPIRGATHDPN